MRVILENVRKLFKDSRMGKMSVNNFEKLEVAEMSGKFFFSELKNDGKLLN